MINEYDNDNKGYITIKEFENFVLTAESEALKQSVVSRLSGWASLTVLESFGDLLLAEVDFNQELNRSQQLLLPLSDSVEMFHHLSLRSTFWDLWNVEYFL